MKINIKIVQFLSVFYQKMFIFFFKEFNNNFCIDIKAMSNIRIEDIGKDISIVPKKKIMRDQKPETIHDPEFTINVNLHPTVGTH